MDEQSRDLVPGHLHELSQKQRTLAHVNCPRAEPGLNPQGMDSVAIDRHACRMHQRAIAFRSNRAPRIVEQVHVGEAGGDAIREIQSDAGLRIIFHGERAVNGNVVHRQGSPLLSNTEPLGGGDFDVGQDGFGTRVVDHNGPWPSARLQFEPFDTQQIWPQIHDRCIMNDHFVNPGAVKPSVARDRQKVLLVVVPRRQE
jgi:hypothetical protein